MQLNVQCSIAKSYQEVFLSLRNDNLQDQSEFHDFLNITWPAYFRYISDMARKYSVTCRQPTTTMFLENKTYRWLFAASLVAILFMWAPDQEIDQLIVSSFRILNRRCLFNTHCCVFVQWNLVIFPLALMGVLAPGSAHAWPSAQPPINTSGNFRQFKALFVFSKKN